MKKLKYMLLGAAGLLMASCSNEEIQNPAAEVDGNYRITVQLPAELATRAVNMNTGYTAQTLNYAVYDADDKSFVFKGQASFEPTELKTTVGLNLAYGKSYIISFFAQAEGSENVYLWDGEAGTLTVEYKNMTNKGTTQNDIYDCFVNNITTPVIGSTTVDASVILYRPVAQINWGTNDLGFDGVKNYYGTNGKFMQATLTTEAYNKFNLVENAVDQSEDPVTVELADFTQPLQANNNIAGFPVTGYTYVTMQYLLAPGEETLYDLNLNINNEVKDNPAQQSLNNDVEVANAPVQANYRTNIYGSLLTDNVNVVVEKSPNWGGQYNLPQGEGEAIEGAPEGITYNPATKTYYIYDEEGLEYYATHIGISSVGNTSLQGTTVLLANDITMTGNHTPFYLGGAIFDGQDHTITGLTVSTDDNTPAAFITYGVGYVQNINFENANITGHFMAGVAVGNGIATRISNVKVNNSKVTCTAWLTNDSYDDGNNVGGIVGYLSGEGTASCTDCTVSNTTIEGYRQVGSIVGRINGTTVAVIGNTATENTIYCNLTNNYNDLTLETAYIGEIYGQNLASNATIQDNTATNVNIVAITGNGFAVSTPQALIDIFNQPVSELAGKTVTLTQDVDFSGVEFTPIAFWNPEKYVTFDGGNHTISNLTIPNVEKGGLFGSCTMNIQNLNIDGLTSSPNNRFIGLVGNLYGNMTNVHVKNVNIISKEGRVGALVGIHNGGSLTDCSVENAVIEGTWSVGGLVGAVNETDNRTYSGCSVTNVKVTNTHRFGGVYNLMEGVMVGNINISGMVFEDCTITDCGGITLPINNSFNNYMWNGEEIKADIDSAGNPLN